MGNIKVITRDTIPCWYELSWRGEQGIVLRIHSDFVNANRQIPADAPIVGSYVEGFGFTKFNSEFGKDFGFEHTLKFLGEKDNFHEYSVPTPLARKDTGKKCPGCRGSGKSSIFHNGKCLYCDGEGKRIVLDYKDLYAISATLTVLFRFMEFPETETHCPLPQLMTIRQATIMGSDGGSIGGRFSREAVGWMKATGPGEIPEMVSVMKSVWVKMDGGMKSFYNNSFRANLSNNSGLLCANLPGEACCLHPHHDAEYGVEKGRGFEFSSHNVDTPQQQLTILASLSALHDLIRRKK